VCLSACRMTLWRPLATALHTQDLILCDIATSTSAPPSIASAVQLCECTGTECTPMTPISTGPATCPVGLLQRGQVPDMLRLDPSRTRTQVRLLCAVMCRMPSATRCAVPTGYTGAYIELCVLRCGGAAGGSGGGFYVVR
jgi:hypothetical protein